MPEGHTIHRIARRLSGDLRDQAVGSVAVQPRFAATAARLDGRRLDGADARGKHLFVRFEGETTVHVHLGLFGRFQRLRRPESAPTGALRWRVIGSEYVWDLRGPTACEVLDEEAEAALVQRLGPDPLRSDADPARFIDTAGRSRRGLGALLLDQSVIAGIGNVYRAEFCFLAGVHPVTPGRDCGAETLRRVWDLSVAHLRRGEKSGRIVTVDPAEVGAPSRSRLTRGERTYVYKQRRCLRCGSGIVSFELGARTAFACPTCQPPPVG